MTKRPLDDPFWTEVLREPSRAPETRPLVFHTLCKGRSFLTAAGMGHSNALSCASISANTALGLQAVSCSERLTKVARQSLALLEAQWRAQAEIGTLRLVDIFDVPHLENLPRALDQAQEGDALFFVITSSGRQCYNATLKMLENGLEKYGFQ